MLKTSADEPASGSADPQSRRRPTSHDVARAAGVAQSTVSRAFVDDSKVSQKTKDHVRKVAADLGYVPNMVARSLITKRSNMVGVIVTEYTLKYGPDVVYTLGEALSLDGIGMMLLVVKDDAHIGDAMTSALEYPLDGLISCAIIPRLQIEHLIKRGVALVFFNRNVAHPGVDSLLTNHEAGAAEVAHRFMAAGFENLVVMAGPSRAPVSLARARGFIDALSAEGRATPAIIETDYSYDAGHRAFIEHVRRHGAPDAVFCVNDNIAMGVEDACRYTLELRVPEDVSIVGFDDVREAARPTYALTTMQQQLAPMARQAVDLLKRRILEPEAPGSTVMVQARLIERKSALI